MTSNGGRSGRVLLVDDEPAILHAYSQLLRRAGMAVTTAGGGAEALALLEPDAFDVIVSDVWMPRMSGIDFLREVRAKDLDVAVILISAARDLETALRAVEYGAVRYLAKPVDTAALVDAVKSAVTLHGIAKVKREALELVSGGDVPLGDRASLEVRFENALRSLWMAFQPIVSLRERKVYAYEALVRSSEPALARPDQLLTAAHRLARLGDLGRAIRAQIASEAPAVPAGAKLFVNLHASDLEDDDLHSADSPLSAFAKNVVLEITERASLDGLPELDRRMSSLRSMGYRLAIDDLGAGYAGLASFTLLEPDVAKLDMSIIRGIDSDPRKQRIVRSMRELCQDLEVHVVSEGVETPAERDTLADLGCDLLQGYLFAKPDRGFPAPAW